MKILLANSVGTDKYGRRIVHFPSRWTASITKGGFSYYPYELAYLSALLKKETDHDIIMIDGNLKQFSSKEYIEYLKNDTYNFIIMETAAMVYKQDLEVALHLKQRCGCKIIFAGAYPTAFPEKVLKDGVDYVCLGEYENSVLQLIQGKKEIHGIYPYGMAEPVNLNLLPFPEDNDICRYDYRFIHGCDYRQIELFCSRGCPMRCNFCVAGNLYYKTNLWRQRSVENIINEIKYCVKKYPKLEGFFFNEEFHNANKKFILKLCEAICSENLNYLNYDAMCGVWTFDEEMIAAMKKAGYNKIRIGIESLDTQTLKSIRKKIDVEKIKTFFLLAKKYKIDVYATFTFGGLGSSKKGDMKTYKFIKWIVSDNLISDIQLSICTPQPGTPFYNTAKEKGYLLTDDTRLYDGALTSVVSYPGYTDKQIVEVYKKAKLLMRIFYWKKRFKKFIINLNNIFLKK